MNEDINSLTDDERIERIATHMSQIIALLGEDNSREGLRKTPMRAAKALYYLTSGYRSDAASTLRSALFEHDGARIVTVRDIEFYSMCEHHILPFYGTVSIAYIPGERIVGLSKLARVVDICAHKLQVQERLTSEIAKVVTETLEARGVLVICQAQHMCMKMRGVEKQNSTTVTMEYTGEFAADPLLRREAADALKG